MFRVSNKEICKYFDTQLLPVTWWFCVQQAIPHIMGLPSDLKAGYYAALLCNYFRPLPDNKRRCFHMRSLGDQIDRSYWIDDRVYSVMIQFESFTFTAKGRTEFLSMLQEWEDAFDDYERDKCIDVVRSVRNRFENAFLMSPGAVVDAGARTFYNTNQKDRLLMEEEFNNWRRVQSHF
jgi:hypothetical protein